MEAHNAWRRPNRLICSWILLRSGLKRSAVRALIGRDDFADWEIECLDPKANKQSPTSERKP